MPIPAGRGLPLSGPGIRTGRRQVDPPSRRRSLPPRPSHAGQHRNEGRLLHERLWLRSDRDEKRLGARALGVGVELCYLDVPVAEIHRRLAARTAGMYPGRWRRPPSRSMHGSLDLRLQMRRSWHFSMRPPSPRPQHDERIVRTSGHAGDPGTPAAHAASPLTILASSRKSPNGPMTVSLPTTHA